MGFTTYAIVKLTHVLLASLWVGAATYDYLYVSRPLKQRGGAAALKEYVAHADRSTPFFAIIGIGTLLSGYETARRFFADWNPFGWPDAGGQGVAILVGIGLAVLTMAVGIMQVTPNVRRASETGDQESNAMLGRIVVLGAIDVALLVLLVVLMVGTNTASW